MSLSIILTNYKISAANIINERKATYAFVNHIAQISKLRDKLLTTRKVGITGITGKGKSELVRKYVEEYKDQYEIIAFLDTNTDLTPQYISLAQNINNTICIKEGCLLSLSPKNIQNNIIDFLTYRNNWLLIFDNLQVQQNNKLNSIMNWENNGHIIIVSQDTAGVKSRIKVPYLHDNDAKILITKIMPNIQPKLAQKIIAKCKGYPYLISHITTFIANYKHKNIDEVINYIDKYDNPVQGFTGLLITALSPTAKNLLLQISLLNNQEISRNLINIINTNDTSDAIDDLVRFGVLEQIGTDINNQLFQLHDVVKTALINTFSKKIHQKNINEILDNINNIMPTDSIVARYAIISEDKSMIGNLEKIMSNADNYSADLYKSMELRKYVLDYYIGIRYPVNCRKLSDWLLKKQSRINLSKMSDTQKDIYAYYLIKIGLYEDVIMSNYKKAMERFFDALNIANTTKEPVAKYVANFQLAKVQITLGDIDEAQKSIDSATTIVTNNHDKIKDDKLWYLQTKIFLAQGDYKKALTIAEDGLLQDSKTEEKNSVRYINSNLLKVEALNYLGNYKIAYDIVYNLYLLNKNHIVDHQVTDAKILIQLSRAELGLNKTYDAVKYSQEAIVILTKGIDDIDHSINKDLADGYAIHGDVLTYLGQLKEAIYSYDKAERIYYNLYRQNIKNMDEVSYVLSQGAKTSCQYKNRSWYERFMNNLLHYFGDDHFRVHEAKSICSQYFPQL